MKTVMITGANSGLGFETAKKIAENKEYAVILACRNPEKAEQAEERIVSETDNKNISVQILDTSSLTSVRNCVDDIRKKKIRLDALICNAGISPLHHGTTADGYELVFATNYLGHYLLVMELLSSMNPYGRIINVTSDMHNPPRGIQWKGADYLAYHAQDDRQRYSYSKLSNILFTYRLADELKKRNSTICVNCFNPGYMADTNFSGGHANQAHTLLVKKTMPQSYSTLEGSSDALTKLVTEQSLTSVSGEYYDRIYGIGKSSELSYNQEVQNELWMKSQEYAEINAEEILNNLS